MSPLSEPPQSDIPCPPIPDLEFGWCWIGEDEPGPGMAHLKECGFDGIELWPAHLDKFGAPFWNDCLQTAGLRCLQLCPYFDFMGGETTLARSRADLAVYLEHADVLHCRRIRVFTGPPWGEGVVGARQATPRQWDDAIRGLGEFCDQASAHGVELCLECHEGSLMEDSPSALRLLTAVNKPNLTVNLQLPLLNEDWETSVRLLGPFTRHLHIHNWRGGLGVGPLVSIADGAFDWLPVLSALASAGASRLCLSIEHVDHDGRDDPKIVARHDGKWLSRLRKIYVSEKFIDTSAYMH